MPERRVVLLTVRGESGRMTASYLARRFPDLAVIVEYPESRRTFLKRRVKRFGWFTVFGQLAFMVLQRFQQRLTRARISEICRRHGLSADVPSSIEIIQVSSANSALCIEHLVRLDPVV